MSDSQSLRSSLLSKPVKDLYLKRGTLVSELIETFSSIGGFSAAQLYEAQKILSEMLKDEECLIMMSITANIIATGIRGLVADIINKGLIDVFITTGGTIDHDIARSYADYFCGSFDADDEMLRELDIHRLGNIYVPKENYGPLIEEKLHTFLENIVDEKNTWSCREILWRLGEYLGKRNSILWAAFSNKVPIYVPGFYDGAFGTHILTFNEKQRLHGGKTIKIDYLLDMKELSEIIFSSKKLGGIIVGGGISKHHLIWWSQFKEGLDYAIYMTVAVEWDGSLSGARPREAISWGKIKPKSKKVLVYSDATITLPMLFLSVYDLIDDEKLRKRKTNSLKIIENAITTF
ncbi:MAG TPA: deoxyhypusine synthase [Thermoprotei archaeon]|nr:MAG: deoxyhypusine synthase [Thermoprotei archaeon]HDI75408.1 deoxyhypusine synthase [Thermoprotei archaeon]